MSFIPLLQEAPGQQNLFMTVVPFILIIGIFYFFIIRPQNKKQKETEKMINALKKGDKVVTIGGIHGVVSSVKEKTVIVKVDSDAKIEFNRSAIASVISDKPVEKAASKKAKKAEPAEEKAEEKAPVAEPAPAAETAEPAAEQPSENN